MLAGETKEIPGVYKSDKHAQRNILVILIFFKIQCKTKNYDLKLISCYKTGER